MSVVRRASESIEAEAPQQTDLPGFEPWHELFLVLPAWKEAGNFISALTSEGADLSSVQIARHGGAISARCRFKGISSQAARQLAVRLLETGAASQARVEHLVLAATAAEARS